MTELIARRFGTVMRVTLEVPCIIYSIDRDKYFPKAFRWRI